MAQGFIQVSEPLVYLKNQCIQIRKGQSKMICLLKGKLKQARQKTVLSSGDVFGLEQIINLDNIEEEFIVLEDSTIVSIEGEAIEELMKQERVLLSQILISTIWYINDVKENLIKGTTASRP